MKKKIIIWVMAAVIGASGLTACSTSGGNSGNGSSEATTQAETSTGASTLSGDPMIGSYTVSMSKETFKIELVSNTTTGYSWVTENVDENAISLSDEYKEFDHDEEMTGVGGTQTFSGTVLQAGTSEFDLTYKQDWDGGDTYMTYHVTVTSGDDLTVMAVDLTEE